MMFFLLLLMFHSSTFHLKTKQENLYIKISLQETVLTVFGSTALDTIRTPTKSD